MKILTFDTETSALLSKDTLDSTYTVQLSWILYNTENLTQEENDFVFSIPVDINNSHIHGITKEKSNNGYEISEIIDIFMNDVKECDILVGHNLVYDLNMIELELYRLKRDNDIDLLYSKKYDDTMFLGQTYLKQHRYPKLQHLYTALFNKEFENSHNALFDVKATLRCYLKLQNN